MSTSVWERIRERWVPGELQVRAQALAERDRAILAAADWLFQSTRRALRSHRGAAHFEETILRVEGGEVTYPGAPTGLAADGLERALRSEHALRLLQRVLELGIGDELNLAESPRQLGWVTDRIEAYGVLTLSVFRGKPDDTVKTARRRAL